MLATFPAPRSIPLLLCGALATALAPTIASGQPKSATAPAPGGIFRADPRQPLIDPHRPQIVPAPDASYRPYPPGFVPEPPKTVSLEALIGKPDSGSVTGTGFTGWQLGWAEPYVPRDLQGYEIVRQQDEAIADQPPRAFLLRHVESRTEVAVRRWHPMIPTKPTPQRRPFAEAPQPVFEYEPWKFHGAPAGLATFSRIGVDGYEHGAQFVFRDGKEYFEIRACGPRGRMAALDIAGKIHRLRREPGSAVPIRPPQQRRGAYEPTASPQPETEDPPPPGVRSSPRIPR